ncbi:hypothetical protein [Pseudoclavibacter sp. AY1H1]|uniref:hypothetical protein n=1 Tax=Pseudoclavibacter sp. AY1H1 TaxID=2080584 RepID=UPI000CE8DB18|nr:hypothetical protein [Pseudoclavibacter sp. AY1H1]PPF39807.1 hypothetical protein C5E05_00905 [Pseudoclavibacter sp. AY1H1]
MTDDASPDARTSAEIATSLGDATLGAAVGLVLDKSLGGLVPQKLDSPWHLREGGPTLLELKYLDDRRLVSLKVTANHPVQLGGITGPALPIVKGQWVSIAHKNVRPLRITVEWAWDDLEFRSMEFVY